MKTFKKTMLLAAAALGLGTGIIAVSQSSAGFGQPQQAMSPFTDQQSVPADLARLDAALNSITTFEGRFRQFNPDGTVDNGKIFVSRPGRMRFEFEGNNPLLVVSDGVTLVQHDKLLETTDRVPLSATPLNFFLKENVALARDTEVISLLKSPQDIRVTSRDGSGEMDGALTMIFDAQTLAFKAWIVEDVMGGQTVVELTDLRYNGNIDPRLYIFREDGDRRDRRDRRRR